MTATVIVPTTGSLELEKCVNSVLSQTYDTICHVVCDGEQHFDTTIKILNNLKKHPKLKVSFIQENVGAKGFYGHRIYAAFTHLVNTEYILYLDQDNFFDSDHVDSCVDKIQTDNLLWCYSLRRIVSKDLQDEPINDDCESLGKYQSFNGIHHVDTNCYCIKTEQAIKIANIWHGGWGQDRIVYDVLSKHFSPFECTGKRTVNYRLSGNENSVKKEFFIQGNEQMLEKYKGEFPWVKV